MNCAAARGLAGANRVGEISMDRVKMSLSDEKIARLVAEARRRAGLDAFLDLSALSDTGVAPMRSGPKTPEPVSLGSSLPKGSSHPGHTTHGIFASLGEAVHASRAAFERFREFPLQRRQGMIERIRQRLRERVQLLAEIGHEETGLGRTEDKVTKNLLVIDKTPGPEILRPESQSGDHGLVLTEWAPYGIIGAITPVTNPSETVINNGIAMLAAGNTVVFNGHPSAKRITALTISLINEAAGEEGAPRNLLSTVTEPTLETAQALMVHPEIRLLVVTGGPGVVRAALDSGKKCITAGPGNPPAVVDETANVVEAAGHITAGASLDNNIICTAEKLIIAVDAVSEALITELRRLGNYILRPDELEALSKVIFEELRGPRQPAVINRSLVGKNASVILRRIGVSVPDRCRLAIAVVDNDHPLLWTEQMMPVLPLTTAPDADRAMELAVEMEGDRRHTFVMHSKMVDRLSRMARMCDASIFVKNGPNFAGLGGGGEGPTSFTIATPTGEGLTDPRSFSRRRRCTLVDDFRIV